MVEEMLSRCALQKELAFPSLYLTMISSERFQRKGAIWGGLD